MFSFFWNNSNLIFKIANGVLNDRELSKETVYTNSERSYIEFDNVDLENEISIENYLNGDLARHKVMNTIKVK